MTDSSSYLTIQIAENGAPKLFGSKKNGILETSPDLLNKSLALTDISIGEFKTIMLIKQIGPDGYHTWLTKHPPEVALCRGCTNCKCSVISVNDKSLWIMPKNGPDPDSPPYLAIQITEDGEIESVKVRNIALEPSESLWDKPLSLGDTSIGGFLIITLIKLIKPDNSYTWLIRHPLTPNGASPETDCVYTYTGFYEPVWIKPAGDIS